MYAWLFRHLPGPLWLKIVETIALLGIVFYVLMEYFYPWFHLNIVMNGTVT